MMSKDSDERQEPKLELDAYIELTNDLLLAGKKSLNKEIAGAENDAENTPKNTCAPAKTQNESI